MIMMTVWMIATMIIRARQCRRCIQVASLAGLTDTDDEYMEALREALLTWTADNKYLTLLATMIAHRCLNKPLDVWEEHADELARERQATRNLPPTVRKEACLHALKEKVGAIDTKAWAEKNLPLPPADTCADIAQRVCARMIAVDKEAATTRVSEDVPRLNAEQKKAFDYTVSLLHESESAAPESRLVYVDRCAGAGKTFLYSMLLHYAQANGMVGVACALTGLAAKLLAQGVTAHKLFDAPMPVTETTKACLVLGQFKGIFLLLAI